MKFKKVKYYTLLFLSVIIISNETKAQKKETHYIKFGKSYNDTIIFKREVVLKNNLYFVKDYYPNGKLQLQGTYSSFNKKIKVSSLWCNYSTNTKEGEFKKWYKNGQLESKTNYQNGLRHGLHEYWYKDGKKESVQDYRKGKKHGNSIWWKKDGTIHRKLFFRKGINQNPIDTTYQYISYLPKTYKKEKNKKWPLIIYLHGGSSRGNDTLKLYSNGIPDQIWRGREFPFVIVAPQCPLNHRWSTDNWFENFYKEVIKKYRIDTNRIYLTGESLGGSGTWYLAMKYPEIFAAIAPMSGFTRHHNFIVKNTSKLKSIPIWAFHGKKDLVVEFEETEWIINKVKNTNSNVQFKIEPNIGHWMGWIVYKEDYLYEWFLKHKKTNNTLQK
jgi:antitoxin component YwqK of YwqJK toxin-antitoxin module